MPNSRYPRRGQRIAPQFLHEILNVPLPAYLRRAGLPRGTKLCDLDENAWDQFTLSQCLELSKAVVQRVQFAEALLKDRLGKRLLPVPQISSLDDLELEARTRKWLQGSVLNFTRFPHRLGSRTITEILNEPGFSARYLVDLLTSLEFVSESPSLAVIKPASKPKETTSKKSKIKKSKAKKSKPLRVGSSKDIASQPVTPATSTADDQRQAAQLYVTELNRRFPFLRYRLNGSLRFQLAQYDKFADKRQWAKSARAAFDAKVKHYWCDKDIELPLWPDGGQNTEAQPVLDFAEEFPKDTEAELLEEIFAEDEEIEEIEIENRLAEWEASEDIQIDNPTSAENVSLSLPNVFYNRQVSGAVSRIEDHGWSIQEASQKIAFLLHHGFDPEQAKQQFEQIDISLATMSQGVSTLKELAASLQSGATLTPILDTALTQQAEQIRKLLGDAEIRRDDPRLGVLLKTIEPKAETVGNVVEAVITRTQDPFFIEETLFHLDRLRQKIEELSRQAVEDEFRDLIKALRYDKSSERNEEIMSHRYGWNGKREHTLQATSDAFGISRERVRQICKPVENTLPILAEKRPFAPALDQALSFVMACVPAPLEQIARQMAETKIMHCPDLKWLSQIAIWLGREPQFAIQHVGGSNQGQVYALPTGADGESLSHTVVKAIVRIARKTISRWGVGTTEDIVSQLSHELPGATKFTNESVTRVLESQQDFAWLDKEHGWFWLSSAYNSLFTQIDKVLAVAPHISVAELRSAVSRHHRRQGFAPPQRVLLELCRQAPPYKIEGNRIMCQEARDLSHALSEAEWFMVEVLKEHGPIMQRAAFEAHCSELGITRSAFYIYLDNSPAIYRYARGVYGLVGASVEPGVIEALIPEHHWRRREVLRDFGWTTQGKVWLGYKLSQGMLSNGACSIPSAMRRFLQGQFTLFAGDGSEVGNLMCSENQARGIGAFFKRRGGEVGDYLLLLIELTTRKASIELGDESLLEQHQSGENYLS